MSWEEKNGRLEQVFEFKSFKEALSFVNTVGDIAEKQDHHPDILLFDYRWVRITTFTHDAQSITQKDYDLVHAVDLLL